MLYDKIKLQNDLQERVAHFKEELKTISTGKPNAEAIEGIDVEAYGTVVKLNTIGQVIVEDAISVKINVWDKSALPAVDKAMRESTLGASVYIEGDHIRLRFSPITEDYRKEKVKELGQMLEEAKVRVRQIRQDYRKKLEALESVPEDEVKRDQDEIQKEVDKTIDELDAITKKKESDLMTV